MSSAFVYPIRAARGPQVERLLAEVRRAGAAVWPEGSGASGGVAAARAVLLLAGDHLGQGVLQLMEAQDGGRPVRAVVFDEAGARLALNYGLWSGAFDFRLGFESALSRLLRWLGELGMVRPVEAAETPALPSRYIFISYPGRDREFVLGLNARLAMVGWEGWFYQGDERDYTASSWVRELDDRIERATGMICVLSEEWRASPNCLGEWQKATRLNKPLLHLCLRPFADTYLVSDRLYIEAAGDAAEWFPKLTQALRQWETGR
jgi:hypothetical protein